MFWSLFSSKNQKLVKKWVKEHEQIVVLAHKVIADYSNNNHAATKKDLVSLRELAVNHIMTEDLEFYKLLKDKKRFDSKTEKLIDEFTDTFRDTKLVLMDFLSKYTRTDAVLDDEFFKTFNEIVGVLAERIAFEEKTLYATLSAK